MQSKQSPNSLQNWKSENFAIVRTRLQVAHTFVSMGWKLAKFNLGLGVGGSTVEEGVESAAITTVVSMVMWSEERGGIPISAAVTRESNLKTALLHTQL